MKSLRLPLSLFALTAVGVYFYPSSGIGQAALPVPVVPTLKPLSTGQQSLTARPKIEVVFVLDTTGSMGGMIQAAKDKIWSIASNMASAQPAPDISIGLVAYRDRGDSYVTRTVDLSKDLDSVYAQLMGFQADGGGDGPESVNQALHEAVTKMTWSQDSKAYKVVFLVGDAPPHTDYQNDVDYQVSLQAASSRGIVVNTIQCGVDGSVTPTWQQIATLGHGQYFQVEQTGSAVAVTTPYDAKLAELSAQLDATRLFYGNASEQRQAEAKTAATDKLHAGASVASRARRALFNAAPSGRQNLLGDKELVDDVASGKTDLSQLKREELPKPLQALAPAAQQKTIAATATKRKELEKEIDKLGHQRNDYLREKVDTTHAAKDSLDAKLFGVVREQAAGKGLKYERDKPTY